MDTNNTDIAWCAGFFDGEGHVGYSRGYPNPITYRVSPMLQCSIPQNSDNVEVLEFFQTTIGFGKIKGPYVNKVGNSQFRLIYGIKEVSKLMDILSPYLKSKKKMDFTRALMQYELHDPRMNEDDMKRMIKRNTRKE